MRKRLDILFDVDTKSRWRIIVSSSLVVALFGFIAQSGGSSLQHAQIGATTIGVIIFCAQVFLYAMPAKKTVNSLKPRRDLFRAALTVMASGLLAILASASAPVVEAAVLNRRLRDILKQKQSVPSVRAIATSNIVSYAMRSNLKISNNLVASATNEFWREKTPEAWQAYVALLNYTVNWRASGWDLDVMRSNMQDMDSFTNVPPCGPDNEATMFYQGSVKNGRFGKFDSLQFWPHGIHNCTLSLDRKSLKDYFLFTVILEYHGGPLTLENIRFSAVRFVLEDNPNVRKFADALLRSNDNIVTIHIE